MTNTSTRDLLRNYSPFVLDYDFWYFPNGFNWEQLTASDLRNPHVASHALSVSSRFVVVVVEMWVGFLIDTPFAWSASISFPSVYSWFTSCPSRHPLRTHLVFLSIHISSCLSTIRKLLRMAPVLRADNFPFSLLRRWSKDFEQSPELKFIFAHSK